MSWFKKAKKKVFYRIRLRWEGADFEETIETSNSSGARKAIKARFPGCQIRTIVRHKI